MTRIYYRGPDAVVTSDHIVWLTEPVRSFPRRELRELGIVRAAPPPASAGARVLAGVSVLVAVVATGAAAYADSTTMWVTAAIIDVVAVICVWGALGRRTRTWEIHAKHHGAEVVVYASRDDRVFHQVQRAIRRSMEMA
ncbi:DUF6232 family protein [Paractinoplanes atraurantiacus]|uniref:DUF6232 family protein n=1 Tax=Paractinoplanes atraurantiacus TaxID=1036182 RepID=UPI0011775513|nr:DUF6232 family protein [Actinoplanes atraurantiacus]